jgi:putative transposase
MSTYTQIFYHITFSTKERRPCLLAEGREKLFRYIWGVIKNRKGHLYRINAVEDHLHIFSDLHPSISLGDYIKEIKVSTNRWIKETQIFPNFNSWQDGYGAFTKSYEEKDRLIEYIKNQVEHHKTVDYREELRHLLEEAGIEFDEKFLD